MYYYVREMVGAQDRLYGVFAVHGQQTDSRQDKLIDTRRTELDAKELIKFLGRGRQNKKTSHEASLFQLS